MAKYVYPAIFAPEEGGGYSISFPDLDGCFTDADTLEEGMEMARDALCLMLYDMEEEGKPIPDASSIKDVIAEPRGFVNLINCDTVEYRRFYDNKAVKKTLTIPSWLNSLAERQGVNFSYILQNALKQELHIQ